MTSTTTPRSEPSREFGYLCVDDFITSLSDARALKTALETGLIDELRDRQTCTLDQLEKRLAGDRRGIQLLLDLLQSNRVIEQQSAGIALTAPFRAALGYRDLLEAKLDFANLVAPDFLDQFTVLLTDPGRFMRQSRLFNLFDYQRSVEPNPENFEWTRTWMRFTTSLTRYETEACLRHHDFGGYRRMLDIGGNSGEFVLQICKAHRELHGVVYDLPLVCEIGREHVSREPEAGRITFHAGSALTDPLPAGFDVVTFKSMLHDWPELEAKRLLTRASQALRPGGMLLIFERGPMEVRETGLPYSMIPMLLFFRSFRSPAMYQNHLEAVGFADVKVQTIQLETPFFLVTARLGSSAD